MGKARAARERELALEKASQNLKAQTGLYGDFTTRYNEFSQQPNPDDVDALLRPRPPRVGEMPIAEPPNWTGSPWTQSVSPKSVPSRGSIGSEQVTQTTAVNEPNLGQPPAPASAILPIADAAREFQDLTSLGFDFLMRDIMDTATYGEPDDSDIFMESNSTLPSTNTPTTTSSLGLNPRTNSNGAFTNTPSTFSSTPFDVNSIPVNAQTNGSPVLGEGAPLDWANWDDMVREYNVDVDMTQGQIMGQPQMSANGVSQMGMPMWF